ncbi:MAG: glycosyltransferase family 4 protein [Candidatus Brocadiales bacterium]
MKTLHINTERTWRGGEQQTIFLAKGLIRLGHEAAIVCQPGSPLELKAEQEQIETYEIKMRGEADVIAILKLAFLLKQNNYDVVHMHTSHAHTLGVLAVLFSGVRAKKVVSRRVDFSIKKHFTSHLKYLWGVDRYIAVSNAIKDVLIKDGVPSEKIAVVHSGVDLSRFNGVPGGCLQEEFNVSPSTFIIGNVAHLADHKGHEYLIKAIPLVLKESPDVKIFIVGDGGLRSRLEELASELNLNDRLTFTGFRKDVPQFLEFFDLFVLASHSGEGICNAVLEAMAMHKPVVAAASGGTPEIIEDGVNGILVPTRNPESLAAGIISIVRDKNMAKKMGENGRQTVETRFSVEKVVSETMRVYMELMADK